MGGTRLRLVLVLLVLTAFTLTALDSRDGGSPFDPLRRGADAVAGPPLRAVAAAGSAVGGALGAVLPDGSSEELDALRVENEQLRARLQATEGERRGGEQLRALLGLEAVQDADVVPARVIGTGSDFGFAWTATLDAGSRDGLREGQAVVAGAGLVGRTTRVSAWTSTVLLLADPGFTVGGRLARVGAVGLTRGDGVGRMTLEVLDAAAQVKVGDVVSTVQSDLFLPDVPVGTVTRVVPGRSALTRVAEVQPFVDVTALDLVGVVTSPVRTGARTPLGG